MTRDPLDERYAELFAAGRREPAPEATRLRIAAALRAQPGQTSVRRWRGSGLRLGLAVAAAALAISVVILLRAPTQPVQISAEAPASRASKQSVPERNTAAPIQAPAPPSAVPSIAPPPRVKRAPARTPATLEQELGVMQRARAALGRGDASAALDALDRFGRNPGWRQLAVEASLLRIEALARAGRAEEAKALARRFVEQHPNNPLVDRARTFAGPASPSGVEGPSKENQP